MSKVTSAVSPLLSTTWNQGGKTYFEISNDPWNFVGAWFKSYDAYCPWEKNWLGQYRVAPTGCVATAYGQIMKYWKWPPVGNGSHTSDPKGTYGPYSPYCDYGCTYNPQTINYSERHYNWSIMPNAVGYDGNGNPSPYDGGLAVARLLRDFGNAANMKYKPGGSTASTGGGGLDAMKNYYRYNSGATYKGKGSGWENNLRAELDAGRPLPYRGSSSASGGHSFVCDGYASDGTFHFNWGWGGSYNGYYNLSALTPGSYNFNNDQAAVFYLRPAYPSTVWVDDNYSPSGSNDGYTWSYNAFNTIQSALAVVSSGGTVHVKAGTYHVSLASPISYSKDLKLLGNGSSSTIILVASSPATNGIVVSNQSSSAKIDGFTITGGLSIPFPNGGGIYCSNSSLTISNCVIRNNRSSQFGGGIYCNNSSVTISECEIKDNIANSYGGGIYCNNSSATISDCIIDNNSAGQHGGGIASAGASPVIIDCDITNNTAGSYGGGVFQGSSGTAKATNCLFKNNNGKYGGGWFTDQDKLAMLEACVFHGNESVERGGAFYNWTNASSTLISCVFYKNNSLNLASNDGAVSNAGASTVLSNSILWANTPNQIAVGYTVDITNSIIQNGAGEPWFGAGCLDGDPKFVNANSGDYHLQAGSAAIDNGRNDTLTVAKDWDNMTRIVDGDCDGVPTVDMGVYEYVHNYPGDCNCDHEVNMLDFARLAEHWLLTSCGLCDGVDMNRDARINIIDLNILAENWLR